MERQDEGECKECHPSKNLFLLHKQENVLLDIIFFFFPKQGNLWKQPAYHLAVEVCGCCCGEVSFLDFKEFLILMTAPSGPLEERPELGSTHQCKPKWARQGEKKGSLRERGRETEEKETEEKWKELKASAHNRLAHFWRKWISGCENHLYIEDHLASALLS